MNIYFARSIRGNHKADDETIFQTVIDAIKERGDTPVLELPTSASGDDTDKYIYERDIEWLRESDALIAEVSNPSLGVGFEIAYARFVHKTPILCIAREGTRVSAMITGGGFLVRYYREQAELKAQVRDFLVSCKEVLGHE